VTEGARRATGVTAAELLAWPGEGQRGPLSKANRRPRPHRTLSGGTHGARRGSLGPEYAIHSPRLVAGVFSRPVELILSASSA
jgi:hypothetical protein